MNHEQFTYWLKGFIEDKQSLTESDLEKIKAKSNEIVADVKFDFLPTSPNAPYVPYDGTGNPNPIWCGSGTDITTANMPFTFTSN
jgi:hypothetical protein